MKKVLLTWLLCVSFLAGFGQVQPITVAQDGSGTYRTVQAALNAVPFNNTTPITIFIKKGTYKEKLNLAKKQNFVKLVGEDLENTVLVYDDYNGRVTADGTEPLGTSEASSFRVFGNNFSAENITFQNSAGLAGQAPAMWVYGDKAQFRRCRFLGFRDTLYPYGYGSRQYYKDCYIEGTTDFILGSATAWFEDCTLYCKPKGTCMLAPSTPDTVSYGFVFQRCKIVGDAPQESYFLARPWKPFAKTVFLNCEMSNVIKPKGWDHWGKEDNKQDAFFAEFKTKGDGAAPKKRALWSKQLNAKQAALYTPAAAFRGWDPTQVIE
ncbi:pectin esterase [Hymenobacter busanensis]|uniref:Pectinesterase n=1 Tax=Hymenobacter busanensis TaxID=2607656 RepID=A0A7L4ZZF5_9BACT|nr:pectinesterase family protein [Hymenobacter busanensis]KAA9333003.1 pectin esterase [Hymenobacter busanensis]QHJ08323.1 pectin esterase [Hymenobacter busanensis]